MRAKINPQITLDFNSQLKVTREYYRKYEAVNEILARRREILDLFHREVSRGLRKFGRKRLAAFTSEQLLRAILVMEIEGLSYRATVIRIDDSQFLRRFVGVDGGAVMDFTTLSKAYKAIRPKVWKRINTELTKYAIEEKQIQSDCLRADTTAYETNIHYPTDSSLLWDSYRVMGRWIEKVRGLDGKAVGLGRLQLRKVKRLAHLIARRAGQTENRRKLRRPYQALLGDIGRILAWSREVAESCEARVAAGGYDLEVAQILSGLLVQRREFESLIVKVMSQARRRVLQGESVPNSEKILSLFEPHTELLLRGKAGKPIEFGHMVLLQQVRSKFISDYQVFRVRPTDESLVDDILDRHAEMFGALPESFTADKGFYKSTEKLKQLERQVPNVAIAKKGTRNQEETEREHDPVFRSLQRFRAGIEGTISVLKRCFKMWRCLYRSFTTYCASVGAHVFAHNLLVLARL
jgi:IS5 family transposase